jgi:hypothetical protein
MVKYRRVVEEDQGEKTGLELEEAHFLIFRRINFRFGLSGLGKKNDGFFKRSPLLFGIRFLGLGPQ